MKRSCLKPPMNADARRCSAPLIGVHRRASAVPYLRRYVHRVVTGPRDRQPAIRTTSLFALRSRAAAFYDAVFPGKEISIMVQKSLVLSLLAVCPLLAADAKTVEAVKGADRAWADATVKGDAPRLRNLLAEDLTYTHSSGETDTKKIYIDNLGGARKYHKIEYESLDARLYANGDAAVVT